MEKKNTILLTVIAVATLLVAVVGATFAYFTASSNVTGDAASTGEIDTATVGSVGITQTTLGPSTNAIYPGTMNYVGISVAATKSETEADFTLTYDVTGDVTLSEAFKHNVEWRLYRVEASEPSPVSCEPVEPTADPSGAQYSQSCTLGTSLTGDSVGDGSLVKQGTITAGQTTADVSYADQTVSTTGGTAYYYLVVEYPNIEDSQNDDQGKNITATLDKVAITNTAQE